VSGVEDPRLTADELSCGCVSGVEDPRLTADEMDVQRQENIAYEYLCHLEEAKVYVKFCSVVCCVECVDILLKY